MLQDDIKQQVQQATDLIRLVGEHVSLRPRGKEFIGLCPFHDDKNPSMYVSPAKQIYKCFACGSGGDVFSFVMNYHKMTFPEAMKFLAERAGIKLPERIHRPGPGESADEGGKSPRQRLLEANDQARGFFAACLRHPEHGKQARSYVEERRISPQMVEEFQIGYGPDRWDGLVLMAQQNGWEVEPLVQAGLLMVRNREQGGAPAPSSANPRASDCYDRFRHRLMFPICDSIGRVIAFGGRKMRPEDEPKYLNSPESPVFNKSATLYGLHLAKKSIIDKRTAIVVEGYTDVIACHQHGCRNVVSTLGTALTPQHVAELRRYCEKVVLIYDGDVAGIKASDRAVEVFLHEGLDVSIAIIPDELDPGDLFELADGLERWNRIEASAVDALEYQFARLRQQTEASDTITGRQKLIEDYLRRLAQLGLDKAGGGGAGVVRKAMIMQKLSEMLRLSDKQIHDLLVRLMPQRPYSRISPDTSKDTAETGLKNPDKTVAFGGNASRLRALQLAERQLLGCLIRQPALFHQVYIDGRTLDEALTPAEMLTAAAGRLYDTLYQRLAAGQSVSLSGLLADLAERGQTDLADYATGAEAEVEAACGEDSERLLVMIQGAAGAILGHHREQAYRETRVAMAQGDEPAEVSRNLREIAQQMANPSPRRIGRIPGRSSG